MIMNYVSKLKRTFNLTSKETKDVYNTIQLGFSFKEFTYEDVEYCNNEIEAIEGLKYNTKSREWFIVNTPRKVYKPKKTTVTRRFNQAIDKFLREHMSRRLIL